MLSATTGFRIGLGVVLVATACGRVRYIQRDARRPADAFGDAAVHGDEAHDATLSTPDAPDAGFMDVPSHEAGDDGGSVVSEASIDGSADTAAANDAPTNDAPTDATDPDAMRDVATDERTIDAAVDAAEAGPPPPFEFTITDPPPLSTTDNPTVVVRGRCDPSVSTIVGFGTITDSDCSDQTWRADFTLPAARYSARNTYHYTAMRVVDGGTQSVVRTIDLTQSFAILIETPTFSERWATQGSAVTIGGSCARDLRNLSVVPNTATFVDSDCGPDGRWQLAPFALNANAVTTFVVSGERDLAAGGVLNASDSILVSSDTVPPAPPTVSLLTPDGSDANFPEIDLTTPPDAFNPIGFLTPDTGVCVVALDPACDEVAASARCDERPLFSTGWSGHPFVDDNSDTALFAQAIDAAGNRSACVPLGTYRERTRVPVPSECDLTLSGSVSMAELTAALTTLISGATGFLATEDHMLLCLAPDAVVALDGTLSVSTFQSLYILGLRGPGGQPCDVDSSVGNCGRFQGTGQLFIQGTNTTFDNVALVGATILPHTYSAIRELKHIYAVGRAPISTFSGVAIGRISDSFFEGSSAAVSISGSVGEVLRTTLSGGSYFGGSVRRIADSTFAGSNALLALDGSRGPFGPRIERTQFELTGTQTDILFDGSNDFGTQVGFFRADRISYTACTRGGALRHVRAETAPLPGERQSLPFRANVVGIGGATGGATFPDPIGPVLPCP